MTTWTSPNKSTPSSVGYELLIGGLFSMSIGGGFDILIQPDADGWLEPGKSTTSWLTNNKASTPWVNTNKS